MNEEIKQQIEKEARIAENYDKNSSLDQQCTSSGRFHGFIKGAEYGYNLAKQPDINAELLEALKHISYVYGINEYDDFIKKAEQAIANAEKQPNEVEQDTASQLITAMDWDGMTDSEAKHAVDNSGFIYMKDLKPNKENETVLLWTGTNFHPCANIGDGTIIMGLMRYPIEAFTIWKPYVIYQDENGNIEQAHRNEVQDIVFDFDGAIVITNKQLCDIVPKGICAYRAQFIITSDMPSYKELCEQILNGKKPSQAEGSDAVEFLKWIEDKGRSHYSLVDNRDFTIKELYELFTQQKQK